MRFVADSVWLALEDERARKSYELSRAYERIDRLIEALAEVANVKLVMPQASPDEKATAIRHYVANSVKPLERSEGWYDAPRPQITPSGGSPS